MRHIIRIISLLLAAATLIVGIVVVISALQVSMPAVSSPTNMRPVLDPGSVAGWVFNDTNGNGTRDEDENTGLENVKVSLLRGTEGIPQWTDENGRYSFPSVPPGEYNVTADIPSGYATTSPAQVPVNVIQNEESVVNFGVQRHTPTPTRTATSTPTTTYTPTQTPTITLTPTPTKTPTITLTPTETSTPTRTPTITPTPTPRLLHLPLVLKQPTATPTPTPTSSPTPTPSPTSTPDPTFESEPNNSAATADGPLASGVTYRGHPNDAYDLFFFETTGSGPITVRLDGHTGLGVQLQLFWQNTTVENRVAYDVSAPYEIQDPGNRGAGKYFIYIYSAGNYNTATEYTLRVAFP